MNSCGVSSDSFAAAHDVPMPLPSSQSLQDHDRRRRQRHPMPPTPMTMTGAAASGSGTTTTTATRKRRMGHKRALARRSPLVAATAVAALVSTISSSSSSTCGIGPTPVAAFGVGPLHLSSSNTHGDVPGRMSSSSSSPFASGAAPRNSRSGGTVLSSPGQGRWGPQNGRSRRHRPPRPGDEQRFFLRDGGAPPPPPLRMAVTDPETLLGAEELLVEELTEQLRRRTAANTSNVGGAGPGPASPPRRRGRAASASTSTPKAASSSSSSTSPSPPKSSRTTSDAAAANIYSYFGLHRRQLLQQPRQAGLLELDIDLGLDGRTNQGPDRRRTHNLRLGFEVPSAPALLPDEQHTRPPQIIESDLEVLELGAISLVQGGDAVDEKAKGGKTIRDNTAESPPSTSSSVGRSFRPVSSTPAQQRRSVNARKSSKVAVPERKRKSRTSTTTTTTTTRNKSSTMPGFQERNVNLSGRRRAHRDGIRIAEERSGKNLEKIVNTGTSTSARRRANSMAMYKSSASVPDSLLAYTKEIHQATERITPAEEKELGAKTQEAIRLQGVYSSLELELEREPTDEEWCAAADGVNDVEELRATIAMGMEAKNRLVETNLRMVQGVVNMYIRNGLGSQYNAGDLMQEGTMALIRAAEKFEPERGLRFSTYAMYWIRSAVKRSQILQSRVLQVPQRLHETHKRVQKAGQELKAELGRPPTNMELAQASDLSELQLGRCKKAMAQKCFSLDATIQNKFKPGTGGNRKETMLDIVNGKFEDEQYGETQQQLTKEALIDSLRSVLSPHEVDLLLLRFGLMDERTLPHGFAGPLTIAEVSRLVGLKPDKVRRMINKCLSKLRPVLEMEWMGYDESKAIVGT